MKKKRLELEKNLKEREKINKCWEGKKEKEKEVWRMKKDFLKINRIFQKNKKCIELIYLLNDVWKEIKMGEGEKN